MFREHWNQYLKEHSASPFQHKVAAAIMRCRTACLGGHVLACQDCGHREISYNSCRNRHCPKCQGSKAALWVEERTGELLPVPYFHTVFTIPHELNELVLSNKQAMYEILFKAASKTLLTISKNNFKCRLGFFAVLHSWGSTLTLHPHLHMVIPGVGLSFDRKKLVLFKKDYLVSNYRLSLVFRGKFIALLKKAIRDKKIRAQFDDLDTFLNRASRYKWRVSSKAPFNGPETVLKYLARYTHRVAISNKRIVSVDDRAVTFRYKDYRHGAVTKQMTLCGVEFLRRFLLHCLPSHFVRVRYYGFLTRQSKDAALHSIRCLLVLTWRADRVASKAHKPVCRACNGHRLVKILEIPPLRRFSAAPAPP